MRSGKQRKKRVYAIRGIGLMLLLLGLFCCVFYLSRAKADTNGSYMKFNNFDPAAPTGTRQNPFIVLEIVPYRGMGQYGYLAEGQEPVDIGRSAYKDNFYGVINSFAYGNFQPVKKDKLDTEDKTEGGEWYWQGNSKTGQTGYFQKLPAKTGLYDKLTENNSTVFKKNQTGTGDYNWVSAANTDNTPTDYSSSKVWMMNYTLDASYWAPGAGWKFENLETFKKQVLHIPDAQLKDYYVRVVTVTPKELNANVNKFSKYYDYANNGINNKVLTGENAEGEIDLIGNADLISISPRAQAGNEAVINMWEKYGRDLSGKSSDPNRYNLTFDSNDLSWQTTVELFMKIGVVQDRAAFVYDITCFLNPVGESKSVTPSVVSDTANGYINNVYKLCLLLRQRDPVVTYNLYFNTNGGKETSKVGITTLSNGRTTGSYNNPSINDANGKLYWNEYTFLPLYPDGTKPGYLSQDKYMKYLYDCGYIVDWIAGSGVNTIVLRNTYSYNGDSSVVQYFLSYKIGDYTGRVSPKVSYNKEFFDYLQDGNKGVRPGVAAPSQAVEYILKQKNSASYNNKASVRILDIEPCKDFTLTVEDIRNMVPTYTGIIMIDKQTTSEFIGKLDDLNSTYDLIYIGDNTGKMKTDSKGKTIYNDPLLDGLIYLHVGDRIIAFDAFKGIVRDSSNAVIKAYDFITFGNSEFNTNKIFKGYASFLTGNGNNSTDNFTAGSNVKGKTDFYRYSGNDITNRKKDALLDYLKGGYPILLAGSLYKNDTGVIDDTSSIYKFLKEASPAGNERIVSKTDITQYEDDGRYKTSKERLAGLLAKEKLQVTLTAFPREFDVNNPSSLITDRILSYEFTITAPKDMDTAAEFTWSISVDANADGRFEESSSDSKGEVILSGRTKGGVLIRKSKQLESKYTGVIPWKLTVRADNQAVRVTKAGYCAFKNNDEDKTPIHVLQITSNNSTLDLESLMNPPRGKTSLFYKYTKDLDDFNVTIKTIKVSDFQKLYEGSGNAYDTGNPDKTDKLCYTENGIKYPYDMLIFGFGDCYTDISNQYGALNNVQAFIDSGKSVMFTHDTTSFVNLTNFGDLNSGFTNWGYGFNQYLRNRVGLDRFGIMQNALKNVTYDKATIPSQARASGIYKNTGDTAGNILYPEKQGLTNGILVAYSNPKSDSFIYNADKDYPPVTVGNNFVNGNNMSNYLKQYVSKVNNGQITSYPYKIDDSFETAPTHIQYYQINMEDPEIVVWYCLSDNQNGAGAYTANPNDVRNNYYIYSKGNIMYTGVGHASVDGLVDNGSLGTYKDMEVKLFINTMIASYSAGLTSPRVEVTNTDSFIGNNGDYVLYEDAALQETGTSAAKMISFKASDRNILSDDLVVRIYYYQGDNVSLLNPGVYSASDGSLADVYNKSGEESGYYVKSDEDYYFNLPLNRFAQNGKDRIKIVVTNDAGLKGNSNVSVLGRALFDLQ